MSLDVLADDIASIVRACTGVSTLHIWILRDDEAEVQPSTAFDSSALKHVRRFSCNFLDSTHIAFLPTKSLTHLFISFTVQEEALEMDWRMLFRNCSGLTHLLIVCSVETSDEMKSFLEDGVTVDIASTVLRARAQAGPLTLVLIPRALLVVSLVHVPVDRVHEWRTIEDLGRFLIVYPRRVLDAIPEEEFATAFIVTAQLDRVDMREFDDADASCYFMNHFTGIQCDLWDFVEYAQRAPLPSSSDA